MSNIIDSIQLSGTIYTLSAQTSGGGVPESTFSAYTAATDSRIAEDEEVTAAGLNALNDKIDSISGANAIEVTQAEYDALVTGGTVDPNAFYIITDATEVDISQYWTSAQTQSAINQSLSGKQDTLVSGTNIKTINNESILGSGNIDIQGGGVDVVQTTGTSTTDVMSQNAVTSQLNAKATKSQAVGSYSFGESNSIPFIKLNKVDTAQSLNEIYYPKINGKGILSNSSIWAKNNFIFSLVETSAITTSISSSSTDSEIPSAKAVYDALGSAGGGITSGEVETMISAATSGYTARFDEDEEVTAAALNTLNDALGGMKLVKLTQTEYDNLSTKDSNTLYVIVN